MCYNWKASCPLLSRPSCLFSPRIRPWAHHFSPRPASEAAKPPFLLRPLFHHLSFNSWRASGPPVLWCNTACIKPPHWVSSASKKPPHIYQTHLSVGKKFPLPRHTSVSFCIDQDGQIHAEFPHGSHWVLLAFAQIITKWTKGALKAIYGKLLRRSEEHWLISRLTRYMGNIKKKINCW